MTGTSDFSVKLNRLRAILGQPRLLGQSRALALQDLNLNLVAHGDLRWSFYDQVAGLMVTGLGLEPRNLLRVEQALFRAELTGHDGAGNGT